MSPRARAVTVALLLGPLVISARPAPRDPAATLALRDRAVALFDLRERARSAAGIPLEGLQRDLVAIADTLADAGLDTLASSARYRAAGVLVRLGRRADAERQLTLAIGDALRARSPREELGARAYLLDLRATVQPEETIAAARALARRYASPRNDVGAGNVKSTEARAWATLGRWRESLAAARRAAALYARAGNDRQHVFALTQCSQALRFQGRHAEALAVTDSALALARRANLGLEQARALLERATLLRTLGRVDEGLASAGRALELDRRLGNRSHETSTRLFRTSLLHQSGRHREMLAETDSLLRLLGSRDDPATELRMLTARGAALAALGRCAEADTLVERAIARFARFQRGIDDPDDRAGTGTHSAAAFATWSECRRRLVGPEAGWRALELGQARELKVRLGAPEVPDVVGLLARLRERRAALVAYRAGGFEDAAAFVFAEGRVHAVTLPRAAAVEDVRAALVLLGSRGAEAPAEAALARVAAGWFAPVAPVLAPGIERLIIVPPAALDGIPFEALPVRGDRGGARVGERWAVSLVPAAAVYAHLAARPGAGGPVTAFADPPAAGLPKLPAAREEARLAAAGGGTVHAGRAATVERFAAAAAAGGVLHVAAHAVVEPDRPERSGVRLADPDGLLTAGAIEALTVPADLVVLSACRTAQGTALGAEGALGLPRAFLGAGARAVVATRWDVADRRAAAAMAVFYERLRAGRAADEALRDARRALAASRAPLRDRTAFTLYGLGDEPVPSLSRGRIGAPAK